MAAAVSKFAQYLPWWSSIILENSCDRAGRNKPTVADLDAGKLLAFDRIADPAHIDAELARGGGWAD